MAALVGGSPLVAPDLVGPAMEGVILSAEDHSARPACRDLSITYVSINFMPIGFNKSNWF